MATEPPSPSVKSVHTQSPWLSTACYSGHVSAKESPTEREGTHMYKQVYAQPCEEE